MKHENSSELTARGAIRKFRQFMKLRCSATELRKFIEHEGLAPGVSFGGYHHQMLGWQSGCSKSDIIEELITGAFFEEGSESRIINHFGFRDE